jgi:hypothetical protein
MILEEVALQYVNQTEDDLRLIGYGFAIAGGVLAGLTHRSTSELHRAPYFAFAGLLFLVTAAAQLVWLGSIPAISGGYLWVLMLVDVLVRVAVGYGFGVIAMARSRDAYGHGRMAALAFIPLANFWLLLAPSKNDLSANRAPTIPLLTGGLGVLSGFAMLIAGFVLATFVEMEGERMAVAAESDPAMQQVGIDFMIRSNGLEKTLIEIASGVATPSPIDEITSIVKVEGDGTTLRYTYEVSIDIAELPDSMRTGLVTQNCNYTAMRSVIEAGAELQHVYLRPDRSVIGTVEVNSSICGF